MAPDTYAEAADEFRRSVAELRLADPDEHFPYKHDDVVALIDENPPMGPGTPDGVDGTADTSRVIGDYTSRAIADASRDYIDAQADLLRDPSDDTRSAYEAARDRLGAARLDHRQARGNSFIVGAAARRAG
jgi:hypothetical protein